MAGDSRKIAVNFYRRAKKSVILKCFPGINPCQIVYYTYKDDVKVFLFFHCKVEFQQADQQLHHRRRQELLAEEFLYFLVIAEFLPLNQG